MPKERYDRLQSAIGAFITHGKKPHSTAKEAVKRETIKFWVKALEEFKKDKDFVFITPWMGCGLNACGYDAYFIVSDGKGGRVENYIGGYGIETSDIVNINGKIYFRHSDFFGHFEKSQHNHWVFQLYSFDKNGMMKCANADVGELLPAATIFYKNPKFKAVELTKSDRRRIIEQTKPKSHAFNP
jgi:hypothetical protein